MIGLRVLALVTLQAAAPGDGAPATPIVTVRPETVTVAEPFTVTIAVRVPRTATVTFPPGPDSAQVVEAVDPPVVGAEDDGTHTVRTATYRLIAWDTGPQTVTLAAIAIGEGAAARRVEVRPVIFVETVLPADSARRVPRPALDVLTAPRQWWPWALAAAIAIGWFALAWRRLRRRPPPPPLPALALAERALAAVDALGLLEAGEPSRYVALHADVLRGYLSARLPGASRSLTTSELVPALERCGLPLDRIAALLREADQIQFARRALSVARAHEFARDIRAVLAASDDAFARARPAAGPAAGPAASAPKRVA